MTDLATDQSIDTLLTKLGTDDSFRMSFAANPSSALSAIGLAGLVSLSLGMLTGAESAASSVASGSEQTLASKHSFLAVRDELRSSHSGYPFQPIHVDIQPAGALASKESFLAVRDELRTSQIGAPFTPITLDLSPSTSHTI